MFTLMEIMNQDALDTIREMTEANEHTVARIAIATHAKYCGLPLGEQYESKFQAIGEVETMMDYANIPKPQELFKLRNDLTIEMMEDIGKHFGNEAKLALIKCL